MKYIHTLIVVIIFSVTSYAGDIVYISDSFKITLRAGPGIEYKILAFLSSGESVEIISSDGDWTKVKPLNPKYKEGWVLSRFIMKRKPYKFLLKKINEENTKLKMEISQLKKQLDQKILNEKVLNEKLQNITQLYQETKNKYETLKRDSADYLNLKAAYEKNKKELNNMKNKIDKLKKENENLKKTQAHRWFLMGAFVLFSGVILGLILGRQQKRRRSLYY